MDFLPQRRITADQLPEKPVRLIRRSLEGSNSYAGNWVQGQVSRFNRRSPLWSRLHAASTRITKSISECSFPATPNTSHPAQNRPRTLIRLRAVKPMFALMLIALFSGSVNLLAQTPSPRITSVSVPDEVGLGSAVEISVTVRNDGGIYSHSGITVSYPNLNGNFDRGLVADEGDSAGLPYCGDTIWHKNHYQFVAGYLMAEVGDMNWSGRELLTMRSRVTPREAGSFKFEVRSVTGQNENYYGTPPTGSRDHQGWRVSTYPREAYYDGHNVFATLGR